MAHRSVKPTCELGRQMVAREQALGITREEAISRIGCRPQTYINWLRGQEPGREWYPSLERFFDVPRYVILGWLGDLKPREVAAIRLNSAKGVLLSSPYATAAA